MADIAYALRDLFVEGLDLRDPRLKAFLAGYRRRFELDETTFAALPTFIGAAELLQYARLARSLDLRDDREYPEWLTQLVRKLEGRMARYVASLT
jgi:Ser/Thr protein kinase RdoA (MazF antagonist)